MPEATEKRLNKRQFLSVGITGLMGSGKSTVLEFFRRSGYPGINMDMIGHQCLTLSTIKERIRKSISNEIFDEDGQISRKKLGCIVFSDPDKLQTLNAIMHPEMNRMAREWIREKYHKGFRLVFLEAAILFRMRMDEYLDQIIFVDSQENDIIKRIKQRDKMDERTIRNRIKHQKANKEKADYVLHNSNDRKDLFLDCRDIEKNLLRKIRSL